MVQVIQGLLETKKYPGRASSILRPTFSQALCEMRTKSWHAHVVAAIVRHERKIMEQCAPRSKHLRSRFDILSLERQR